MRTTITLDQDVYEAARHLSRSSGERLGKVISELMRRGLARSETASTQGKSRFPAFSVPPGTPIISALRIQAVIDEEGLF